MMRCHRSLLWSCLTIGAVLSTGCEQEKPELREVIRPVRYQRVYAGSEARVRSFSGTAQAGEEARISFRVGGTIQRLPVKTGDPVRAGQLIAELDPTDYDLRVQEAEAALAEAGAAERNYKADYERVRALYENNNTSRQELDAARAKAEAGRASVDAARKKLELAKVQGSYTRLTAPKRGAITEVHVELNENVQQGSPVVTIVSGARPEVSVAVPESFIAQVKQNSPVTVKFDARPGESFSATVTEVGVAATRTATTFPVTVRLDEPDLKIRPGMAAEVIFEFAGGTGAPAFLVPPVAVGEDRAGRFVYVVEPTEEGLGTVSRKDVSVGDLTSEGLEIPTGLADGDRVVTAGVSRIEEGQTVRLPTGAEAPR